MLAAFIFIPKTSLRILKIAGRPKEFLGSMNPMF